MLIFLFNIGGYYLIFLLLHYKFNHEVLQEIDGESYDPEQTITLAIPLSLPYPVYEEDFQRVNGSFEYDGKSYTLIKQRYQADTLFVVCLRNPRKEKLMMAFSKITGKVNDVPVRSGLLPHLLTKVLQDYQISENIQGPAQEEEVLVYNGVYCQSFYPEVEILIIAPPPELYA